MIVIDKKNLTLGKNCDRIKERRKEKMKRDDYAHNFLRVLITFSLGILIVILLVR